MGSWVASYFGLYLEDLAPLIDIIDDLSRAKLSLQRIQLIAWLYGVFRFSLIIEASLL